MAASKIDMAEAALRSKGQLQEFLRFFGTKREVFDSELKALFRDVEDARLGEAMFSVDDVRSILEDAQIGVADAAARELERHANMAGLVLEQVFASAIVGGVDLAIDLSRTEDEAALRRVSELKLLDHAELDATKRSAAVKLDSMRSEHLRLLARVAELEKALGGKMEEMAKAGGELDRLRADRGQLVRRLETAEAAAAAPATPGAERSASAAASEAQGRERDSLRVANASLLTELEDARAEIESLREAGASAPAAASPAADVSAEAASSAPARAAQAPRVTKQFQRMREMLKAKTDQVKELRTRLSKYEPDDVRVLSEADETPLVPKMA